ncbi:MAG: PASTA domain-containing protein [Ignavibacteria bacterium]|nr:PASTA domain-containing protein [Ignavibacteria bacterium]HRJ85190.1 penicillin-binding transpeptidase domain-containing protein [Ignavibacteria bacterium]
MRERTNTNIKANTDRRITIFMAVFALLFLVIMYKLFNIQVLDAARYQLAAKKQYESKISLKSSRGIIFDRKMNALVSNIIMYSFAADPNMVDNKDSVAAVFASIFKKDKSFYIDKLNTKNTSFVWLERRIDPSYEAQVKDINFSGVIKLNEPNRIFNYDKLTSQLVGYTNIDNNGLSGIELELDEMLSGKEGYVVMQKDGLGRKRPAVEYPRQEPVDGNNVILTIDMNIQKIVEEELSAGVEINNAAGGKVIVMNVKTGELLAMHSINLEGGSHDKIAEITDLYEPGSTFKIITGAAALEESILSKYDVINTYGGEYMNIKDAHKYSSLTFQQVIEQSSNVGTIQVANRLGREKFYKYARDFGFGITTGLDLPGEMRGRLKRPVEFSPVSLNYMSIGYEVLVTALQMANAYACVANGGMMMKPFIIKKVLAPDGTLLKEYKPVEIRNVISKNTSKMLTELFVGVVERGTGKDAYIENIKVAGKTGTSQKMVEGKYSKSKYTSSFIGYFPAENPQIVVAVIMDAPGNGEIYGGKVSAPIFRKISERIINLTGLHEFSAPEYNADVVLTSDSKVEKTPLNLVNFDISDAVKFLNENELPFEVEGPRKNAIVISQESVTDEKGAKKIRLVTAGANTDKFSKENGLKMPDLRGMSVRKCIKIMSTLGVDYKVNGSGKVSVQVPEAGTQLVKNQTVIINCDSPDKF